MRKSMKLVFGLVVLVVGLLHLTADVSPAFDFYGINPVTSIIVLVGLGLVLMGKHCMPGKETK